MNNQKPTKELQEIAAKIAWDATQAVFAHYQAQELITSGGKRAMISRTTLAQSLATVFLAGYNHGNSMKGVNA